MKITDQGFTERVSTQPGRSNAISENAPSDRYTSTDRSTGSDNLQLSSLASLLQGAATDDSSRNARVSQIAQAVQGQSFVANLSRISSSIVSEAVQPAAA